MNSNISTNKSTHELKQQILNDIKKVKDDFNEIKHRLTPGQIIDDAIYYRRGAGDPASTFEFLKSNPVGTSFLTLGTLLLMENDSHMSYESLARTRAGSVKTRVNDVMSQTKDKVSQFRSKFVKGEAELESGIGEGALGSTTSESTGTADRIMNEERIERAKSSLQEAKSSMRESTNRAKEKLSAAGETLRAKTHDMYEASKNLDPLTYLVLGAGLGTITGASIPVSEREQQAVDSIYENRMGTFASELQDALNQSINILKNEFISGMTEINVNIF